MAASVRNLRSAWWKRKNLHKQVPAELRKKNFKLAKQILKEGLETLSTKLETPSSKDGSKK